MPYVDEPVTPESLAAYEAAKRSLGMKTERTMCEYGRCVKDVHEGRVIAEIVDTECQCHSGNA
jgi:hypothetical protein